jgi:hypothetical protein
MFNIFKAKEVDMPFKPDDADEWNDIISTCIVGNTIEHLGVTMTVHTAREGYVYCSPYNHSSAWMPGYIYLQYVNNNGDVQDYTFKQYSMALFKSVLINNL